jgi:hypothetical protein
MKKDAETATSNRDILLGLSEGQTSRTEGTLINHISSIRDHLEAKFRSNLKKLGDWGFDVIDNPSSGKDDTDQTPASK